jgi:hypothetical protein
LPPDGSAAFAAGKPASLSALEDAVELRASRGDAGCAGDSGCAAPLLLKASKGSSELGESHAAVKASAAADGGGGGAAAANGSSPKGFSAAPKGFTNAPPLNASNESDTCTAGACCGAANGSSKPPPLSDGGAAKGSPSPPALPASNDDV